MDVTDPLAREAISHWQALNSRFFLLKVASSAFLISRPLLAYLLKGTGITNPWLAFCVILLVCLQLLSMWEYFRAKESTVPASPRFKAGTRGSWTKNNAREFWTYAFISLAVFIIHILHKFLIDLFVQAKISHRVFGVFGEWVFGGCDVCLENPALFSIGRIYVGEFFATLLSVAGIWCLSANEVFLHPKTSAVGWWGFRYFVCLVFTGFATIVVYNQYCAGQGMCYGNMVVAASKLAWNVMAPRIGHLGPLVDLMGRAVLREFPEQDFVAGWFG